MPTGWLSRGVNSIVHVDSTRFFTFLLPDIRLVLVKEWRGDKALSVIGVAFSTKRSMVDRAPQLRNC